MISWKMAAAWVVALVVATVLTWQIVGLADSQVGDTPVAVAPVPTSTVDSIATTTSPASTSTSAPAAMSTTSLDPTTTASLESGSSTPTTGGAEAASSRVGTAEWTVRTINSAGGTVIVRHRPGEVELQAATPVVGFSVEIDDRGPDRVRVEFEGEDDDVRVEVEWEDGELEVSIDD